MTQKPESGRLAFDDVNAIRAIAHPERLAILLFLMSGPARTATECSAEVDATPSACSYHLRQLERFGFVERADPDSDARARPWRAASVGFSGGRDWSDDSAPARAARIALGLADLSENDRLAHRFLDASDDLAPAWLEASEFHTFELLISPSELRRLNEEIASLLRARLAPTRSNAPDDAAPVHVVYQAFPRIAASAASRGSREPRGQPVRWPLDQGLDGQEPRDRMP